MRVLVLALVAACDFSHGFATSDGTIAPPDGRGSDSAPPDVPPNCFGSGLATICVTGAPPAWDVSSPLTFDTGKDCDFVAMSASGELCVKQASTVTISDLLGATGPRPLVIVAEQTIEVTSSGTIDASSGRGGDGPGANAVACRAGMPGGTDGSNSPGAGGGGGAGGSFVGKGGNGSPGAKPGGMAGATIAASAIHGGCAGSLGGNQQNHGGGSGGSGGGAVYLIAGDTIDVAGAIDASGGGGGGGAIKAGGGGGGAGGLAGLDAPHVHVVAGASVFANGGGGGEGGDASSPGNPGEDPSQALTAARGGGGASNGGDGGDGSVGTTLDGGNGKPRATNAGGGGGGGAGAIRVFSSDAMLAGAISPPSS